MRQIVLLVLGIVVGAFGAVSIINTLRQRDAYPRGLMDVMQHHYAALRDDVRHGRCVDSVTHVNLLRGLSVEIAGAVYADDIPDAPFREFDQRLHEALALVPPSDCKTLAPIVEKIGSACDACHRQYR